MGTTKDANLRILDSTSMYTGISKARNLRRALRRQPPRCSYCFSTTHSSVDHPSLPANTSEQERAPEPCEFFKSPTHITPLHFSSVGQLITPPRKAIIPQHIGSTKATKTFNKFRKLPIELRLMIWGFARENCTAKNFLIQFNLRYPIPSLLHVNREAREQALKIYNTINAGYYNAYTLTMFRGQTRHYGKWSIYIDPANDYVYTPEPADIHGVLNSVTGVDDFWMNSDYYLQGISHVVITQSTFSQLVFALTATQSPRNDTYKENAHKTFGLASLKKVELIGKYANHLGDLGDKFGPVTLAKKELVKLLKEWKAYCDPQLKSYGWAWDGTYDFSWTLVNGYLDQKL